MSTRRTRHLVCVVTVVALSGFGCSSSTSSARSTTTAPTTGVSSTTSAPVDTLAPPTVATGNEATVHALDNDFDAKHLQVRVGTTVTFLNIGHNKHNIIPDNPDQANFSKSEDDFPNGSSYTFTFTKPGTYPYYCSLHATPTAGTMRGVITVTR
ncbi:MAG: hypothetical protein JST73_07080 [Actinobacteria bacterium]|nr:hypothetical protein [Actinomycetota bacterium]